VGKATPTPKGEGERNIIKTELLLHACILYSINDTQHNIRYAF